MRRVAGVRSLATEARTGEAGRVPGLRTADGTGSAG